MSKDAISKTSPVGSAGTTRRGLIAALAFAGIVFTSLAVRTAVTALSPISSEVSEDIAITSVGLGLIGALPLGAFAVSGLMTPLVLRSGGFERGIVWAILALSSGQAGRSLAGSYLEFFLWSVVTFLAIGMMTVLIPPLIKRYFPQSQAQLTGVYAACLSVSLMAPAAFSPIWVGHLGWRGVMNIWAITGFIALVPWLSITFIRRKELTQIQSEFASKRASEPKVRLLRGASSRTAWLLSAALAITALNAFVTFAWLPTMLSDLVNLTKEENGVILGLFAIVGFPLAVVIPWVVKKWDNPGLLMQIGSAFFILSYLGLLYFPATSPWVWVFFSGVGTLIFPLVLVLVNHWSRTEQGSLTATAFMQAAGYTIAVWWPIIVGAVHDVTGNWSAPMWLLIGTAVLGVWVGQGMKHVQMIEDEIPGLLQVDQIVDKG